MKKVLIVDDDQDVRSLYKLVLRREGLSVVEAASGPQALSKAKVEPPALVLLDVMMPEMNGYEVCRRLRADPHTAHLPILMISVRATVTDRRKGILAGADDFLPKSSGPRKLVESIRSLISNPLSGSGAISASLPAPSL